MAKHTFYMVSRYRNTSQLRLRITFTPDLSYTLTVSQIRKWTDRKTRVIFLMDKPNMTMIYKQ